MASGKAKTVASFLKELPADRRAVVSAVRDIILHDLPEGYRESAGFGMLAYEVPLERYPKTYNGRPLCYVAVAAQKNHYALYLMGVYGDPEQEKALRSACEKAGKKLDMGKSCVRFQRLEDLPLDAIGKVIASMPPEALIERYEASRKK